MPPGPEQLERVAVAAVFHDIGIWTARTFDYLPPSIAEANGWLSRTGRSSWAPEIGAMIGEHHKLRHYRNQPSGLVEAFRQADLVDVSHGLFAFGLPHAMEPQDHGFMYGWSFYDLDGHHWEVFWMDPSAVQG